MNNSSYMLPASNIFSIKESIRSLRRENDEYFQVFDKFQQLYVARIKTIEEEAPEAYQLKCTVLREWVKDLTDQNSMFIMTLKDVEKEACDRVSQLQKKLQEELDKCACYAEKDQYIVNEQSDS